MLADVIRRAGTWLRSIVDTFTRADGALGITEIGGATWEVVSGTWTITGNKANTSTAGSSNPKAVVDLAENDIDLSILMGNQGGDCIYFRVVDNNNWWRLRYYGNQGTGTQYCNQYQYTHPCICSCTPHCGTDCGMSYGGSACGSCPSCGSYYNSGTGGTCNCSGGSCSSTSTVCGSVACGSYNYDEFRFYLEKCVAGTITTVATSTTRSSTSAAMRVVALGNSITGFRDANVQLFNVTDAAHQSATKHGIGRGPTGNRNNQSLDNFNLVAV